MSKEVETMKKFLLAVAVLCIGTAAFAFDNAGGTLVVSDMNLTAAASNGSLPICGQGAVLTACPNAITRMDGTAAGDATTKFFKVYAAFSSTSSPRLMGLAWGVHVDNVAIPGWKNCGDFELADASWPGDATGNSVTYNTVHTEHLVPVYVFAAYGYGTPGLIATTANPDPLTGGVFGNDNVPADLDPIAGYSAMGFEQPGLLACPYEPPQPGACCNAMTGACLFILQSECTGNWIAGTTCEPTNPCPPPPSGACCDPTNGACTYVIEIACQGPFIWHGGVACAPQNPCPQLGACCSFEPMPTCVMTMVGDCASPLIWHGELLTCDPNNCPVPVPVDHKSWGQIKNLYR